MSQNLSNYGSKQSFRQSSQEESNKYIRHKNIPKQNVAANMQPYMSARDSSFLPLNSSLQSSTQCKDCGLKYDSIKELLNHQRKFCVNSGYDNLNGLIRKEHNRDRNNVDRNLRKQSHQQGSLNKPNRMQNYGAYSLTKISSQPTDPINFQINIRQSKKLQDDMKQMQSHNMNLQQLRPYEFSPKMVEKKGLIKISASNFLLSRKKDVISFQNTKSDSVFSYRLDESGSKFNKPNLKAQQVSECQKKKQKIPQSPASNELYLIHSKDNPATRAYLNKYSVLNKSNSSIENMSSEDKVTYAKFKLDQLKQINQLYLKNGGQQKRVKQNVHKMVAFYQRYLNQATNHKQLSTQLSIASRPQTPILKLSDLNIQNQEQLIKNRQKSINNCQNHQSTNKVSCIQQNSQYQYNKYNRNSYQNGGSNPNYGHLYQLRVMQDMMRLQQQQNKKLIEVLIGIKKQNSPNTNPTKEKQVQQVENAQMTQQIYRFSKQVDPKMPSQDRILKFLRQQQLDQMRLISQLPIDLQDKKLQSLIKNSELRQQMEKQVLQQKMERLHYQEKVQSFEEQRQFKNDDWITNKRKDVINQQVGQYLHHFTSQFTRSN